MLEFFRHQVGGELPWIQIIPDVQLAKPPGIIRLVVGHRHDELGNSCRQSLRASADATMMNNSSAVGKHTTERDKIKLPVVVTECGRKMLLKWSRDHSPQPE